MYVKSRDGRYLGVNKAWEELFGVTRDELRRQAGGRPVSAEPRDRRAARGARPRALGRTPARRSYPTTIVTPDGRRRDTIYYKATYPAQGEAEGLVGAIFDVTARARAEMALRESEERFRAVVDSANEGMLIYDRSLNIIAGNRAAERIVGLPLGQLIGKPGFTSLLNCIREDGTPLAEPERPTRLTVRTGKPQTGLRIGIKRPAGITWLSVNTAFLRRLDETDHYGLVSTITDVTEQVTAEALLKDSEARYRRTFELAGSGIAHIGMDRRFIRVNPRAVRDPGLQRGGDAAGSPGGRSRTPTTSTSSTSSARRCTQARSTRCAWKTLPAQGRRGGVGEIQMTVERDADGKPLYEIAVYDDITAQRADRGRACARARSASATPSSSPPRASRT